MLTATVWLIPEIASALLAEHQIEIATLERARLSPPNGFALILIRDQAH